MIKVYSNEGESFINETEAKRLIALGGWEYAGETTTGNVYWNNQSGEMLSQCSSGTWELRKKL